MITLSETASHACQLPHVAVRVLRARHIKLDSKVSIPHTARSDGSAACFAANSTVLFVPLDRGQSCVMGLLANPHASALVAQHHTLQQTIALLVLLDIDQPHVLELLARNACRCHFARLDDCSSTYACPLQLIMIGL